MADNQKKYQLKKGQEAFEIVDGPMTGKKFVPGMRYEEIPPQEKGRFETVKKEAPAPVSGKRDTAKASKGKEADKS